jgi:hypothetical protein
MNPKIRYIDLRTPFGMDVPLVRKRVAKNVTKNFNNKQEFVEFIESIKPSRRVNGYLTIDCSCGKKYEYNNQKEIPSLNLICNCKRELIIYGD